MAFLVDLETTKTTPTLLFLLTSTTTVISCALGILVVWKQCSKKEPPPPAAAAAAAPPSDEHVPRIHPPPSSKSASITAATTTTATRTATATATAIDPLPVLDVWAERRQRGILPASMDRKEGVNTDKPFSSSYYFAHNNPNTTGGYKDGLKMEDYTMNGPRLLTKGGKPVAMTSSVEEKESTPPPPPSTASAAQQQQRKRRSLPITQYLWDDDGGATGTIIIEQLPGGLRSTDTSKPWSVLRPHVLDIHATLYNDNRAIKVTILTQSASSAVVDWDYHLEIAPLFATAVKVEAVSKPKRLRIKITKKSTSRILASYEKWPHAHKKKT